MPKISNKKMKCDLDENTINKNQKRKDSNEKKKKKKLNTNIGTTTLLQSCAPAALPPCKGGASGFLQSCGC